MLTEDNDVKSDTNCMDQTPPAEKKEEKKHILSLNIDLDELVKFPKIPIPANQSVWQTQSDMSEDYKKLNQTLVVLAIYIARSCNEGPEVKDNINKRLMLVTTVVRTMLENMNISGYDCYGLLAEILQDFHLKISGRKYIEKILEDIKAEKEEIAQEKLHDYTS
jgi:hypothetical protein